MKITIPAGKRTDEIAKLLLALEGFSGAVCAELVFVVECDEAIGQLLQAVVGDVQPAPEPEQISQPGAKTRCVCQVCGKEFDAFRAGAKFCGIECKNKARALYRVGNDTLGYADFRSRLRTGKIPPGTRVEQGGRWYTVVVGDGYKYKLEVEVGDGYKYKLEVES